MEQVVIPMARWTVLVRSDGDALAVRAGGQGLELGFLGSPPGFAPADVATWLSELISVAGTTGSESPALPDPATSIPIPRTLHQALSGLLFYESELWGGVREGAPCTIACVAAGPSVAFGWTGPGRVEVLLDGRVVEPEWILVRDLEGRHARALVVDARLALEARVHWPVSAAGAEPGAGEIEARWPGHPTGSSENPGEAGSSAATGSLDRAAEAVDAVPATPSEGELVPTPARQRGAWHFRSWMDGLTSPGRRGGAQPESIAHDVPGVPDLIPEPRAEVAEVPSIAAALPEAQLTDAPATGDALPEAQLADAPATGEALPEAQLADAPATGETLPEAQLTDAPATGDALPEAQLADAPATGAAVLDAPDGSEIAAAGRGPSVDPFDLGPMAAFDPEPEATGLVHPTGSERLDPPAVAVPAGTEPAPAGEPVVAAGPAAEGSTARLESAPDPRPHDESIATAGADPLPGLRPRPVVRRPAWPDAEESTRSDGRPFWQGRWFVVAVVVALFAGGWFVGQVDFSRAVRSAGSALKAIGFGPARYEVTVASRPSGAWIAVDGIDQARRTPATLELKPGTHEVVLSFSGVGGSKHTVNGRRGQRVTVDAELWGSLKVTVPGSSVPISVAVDGMQRGYAPLDVEQLQPGIHRLQFSGPGVAPWEQTVEVHVNRTVELAAQPIASPATGVLEVRATLADETGSEPLTGAQVWIDGQLSGVTPLKLELPRGPHSIRVRYREEDAPVQVIDLPGGNLRYASIQLGMSLDAPRLVAALPERIPVDRPTVLSASLDGARVGEVREMWLHVRTPEGAWRRYPMTIMPAPAGLVGVAVFPTVQFDARGRAAWYVSASTPMGDDYFTELRPAQAASRP